MRTLAQGRVGIDAIALVAMAGALAIGEYLAGAVVALMLSGGRSLGIARQSVLFGIGLSLIAMGFAAFGYIPPIAGALI